MKESMKEEKEKKGSFENKKEKICECTSRKDDKQKDQRQFVCRYL